jgi:hypothetical protein
MGLFAAIDRSGSTKFVGDVARGAQCGCFCSNCKSPVVSKQGEVNSWHFAHEAGQERPECIPGSINLLRHLAIERLQGLNLLALPPCTLRVRAHGSSWPGIVEDVTWENPAVRIDQWNLDAPSTRPVAQFILPGQTPSYVSVYVEIGPLIVRRDDDDAGVIYNCPIPPEGEITTRDQAISFLTRNGYLFWSKIPDVHGEVQRTRDRLIAHQNERQAKLAVLQERIRAETRETDKIIAQHDYVRAHPPHQDEAAVDLPPWAAWKKPKTSFFAFQLDDDTFWVVMQSGQHDGCFVVPAPEAFDGWDEALPPSVGTADLDRGAYVSEKPIGEITAWFYGRRTKGTRIDGDSQAICLFTNGTD